MTALQDLLAKVEAGWPPDIDTPYMPPFHAVWPDWRAQHAWLANQGSLDAAKALHEAVLPGWKWGRQWSCHMWVEPDDMPGRSERHYGTGADPARAWLIAILKALIAQEGEA